MSTNEQRLSPIIILVLVAAVVALGWLLVIERASKITANTSTESRESTNDQRYEWKLVTSWPKNFPGLGMAPENFAKAVNEMSNGRLTIKVYGGGEIVPALEVFSAVSQGTVEMGHAAAYYWKGKIPASPFFTAVPFGLTAQEMNGWLHYGGGMALWRELYAPFNIIPFAGGNTGVQMAGWFNREIKTIEDLKGLKMRIPGVGGEVFSRAGGSSVTLPGSELYTSLQTGVIDATEWVAPYNDMSLGLQDVAKYYYYPGWHEPGPTLEFTVNKTAFESLPKDLQKIIEVATRYANQDMLDEYTARNNASLTDLEANYDTQLKQIPDDVIRALNKAADEYYRELAAQDEMADKIYQSWDKFRQDVKNYHRISEQAYINARDL